jgi:hypothetical protein
LVRGRLAAVPTFDPPSDAPSHEHASRAELAAYYRVTVRTIRRWGIGAPGHRGRTGLPIDTAKIDTAKIDNPPPDPSSLDADELVARNEVTVAEVRRTTTGRLSKLGRSRRPVDVDDVRRRYESGESVYAIARTLGSTEHLVRKVIERAGMERPLSPGDEG